MHKPREKLWLLFLIIPALLARLYFAAQLPHPGHGDPGFYYTIIESITSGRGLEINYIWHYLTAPNAVTHPGADYWMVFASMLMSIPYFVFRNLFSILVLSSLFGVGIALLAYRFTQAYTSSKFVAFLVLFYLLFEPALFDFSISVDAPVYYVFFVILALFLMIQGNENPKYFVWAGAVTGLAHLTRQDAILLAPTLLLTILLAPFPFKTRLRWMSLALGAYVLVLLPMLVYNVQNFGALLPPGPSRVAFATEHEQVYVYSTDLSLESYLALGWRAILKQKLLTGLANLKIAYRQLGLFATLFVGIAFAELVFSPARRTLWRKYLPVLVFFVLEFLFYTLVATVVSTHGSYGKAILTTLPFFILFAFDALSRHIPHKLVATLLTAALIFPPLLTTYPNAQGKIAFHTEIAQEMQDLAATLQNRVEPREDDDIILMTRAPWEVHITTGYRTIMVPYESLDVIYEVAQRYGANYILLPIPSRPALDDFRETSENDPRFQFIVQVQNSNLKIYRIVPDAP
ncbi:MAG: glycosyltransferase family 39 protein [Anaerolineales bacterium]|nr:glycosyltransferase family 39 protein [Anaerolineales bacterium]